MAEEITKKKFFTKELAKGLIFAVVVNVVFWGALVGGIFSQYPSLKHTPVDAKKNLAVIYKSEMEAHKTWNTYLPATQLNKFDSDIAKYYCNGRYGCNSALIEESDIFIVSTSADDFCAVAVERYRALGVKTLGSLNIYQAASIDRSGKITYANEGKLCADSNTDLSSLPRFTYSGLKLGDKNVNPGNQDKIFNDHYFDATTNLNQINSAQQLAKLDKGSYLMGPQLAENISNSAVEEEKKVVFNDVSNVYVVSADVDKFCAVAVSSYRNKPFTSINQLNVYQAASIDQSGNIVYANQGTMCADVTTDLKDLGRFTSDGFYAPRAVAKKP